MFKISEVQPFPVSPNKSRIFSTESTNQPVAATSQAYYLSFKYSSTCFGHPHANYQELEQLQ
jgi:hypothetical protein